MSLKILIADDEELVRNGLVRYIKNHCPFFDEILEAKNGTEAVDLILNHNPDIVILDVQMPCLTGIDVLRQINNSSVNPEVIILSGFNEFKYAQQAMRYGARDYMMKPVKAQDLVNRICELLKIQPDQEASDRHSVSKGNNGATAVAESCAAYIRDHYTEEISLTTVAEKFGLSSSYLSNKFSTDMKISFVDYVNKIRIEHACDYLKSSHYKIYEICEKVGFRDTKYFSKIFKKLTGKTPKEYSKYVD